MAKLFDIKDIIIQNIWWDLVINIIYNVVNIGQNVLKCTIWTTLMTKSHLGPFSWHKQSLYDNFLLKITIRF